LKNSKDGAGFVVIDDRFGELFGESLPEGHFVQTLMGKSESTFDKKSDGLTQAKAEEAFICLMKPFKYSDLN
jgi:hypothetical protein